MEKYTVKKVINKKDINVEVPGSKSITNRALMLAAISNGKCKLSGVLFSDDSRAFLDCLDKLGFKLEIDENARKVHIAVGDEVKKYHFKEKDCFGGDHAEALRDFFRFLRGIRA